MASTKTSREVLKWKQEKWKGPEGNQRGGGERAWEPSKPTALRTVTEVMEAIRELGQLILYTAYNIFLSDDLLMMQSYQKESTTATVACGFTAKVEEEAFRPVTTWPHTCPLCAHRASCFSGVKLKRRALKKWERSKYNKKVIFFF